LDKDHLKPKSSNKMELGSLRLEESREKAQELGVGGHVREVTHVLTLEEIANLAAEGGQPAETLLNVVALIAKRFETDVCSAYLLEPDRANLVLASARVHRQSAHGNQRRAGRVGGRTSAACCRGAGTDSPAL
jgi:hypothetical protein